jgi:hypothetical protein
MPRHSEASGTLLRHTHRVKTLPLITLAELTVFYDVLADEQVARCWLAAGNIREVV